MFRPLICSIELCDATVENDGCDFEPIRSMHAYALERSDRFTVGRDEIPATGFSLVMHE